MTPLTFMCFCGVPITLVSMKLLVQVQWSSLRLTQLPLMCVELATSPSCRCQYGGVGPWWSDNNQPIHHPRTHCPPLHHHLSGGSGGQLHQLSSRVWLCTYSEQWTQLQLQLSNPYNPQYECEFLPNLINFCCVHSSTCLLVCRWQK